MRKYLVTGGAGFIGSHLVDKLCSEGKFVTVVDNLYSGNSEWINKKAIFINKSVNEVCDLGIVDSFDTIYHLAAQANIGTSLENPAFDIDNNYKDTVKLYLKTKKNAKFIFASSDGAAHANAQNIYGINKYASERALEILSNTKKTPVSVMRFSNVYGPRGMNGVIGRFCATGKDGGIVGVNADGNQTRDFVHVDLVTECLAAAEYCNDSFLSSYPNDRPVYYSYVVGTGKATKILDIAKMFQKEFGYSIEYLHSDPGVSEHKSDLQQVFKTEKALGVKLADHQIDLSFIR
jgi:UDP-glucose 4-epimerase